MEKCGNLSATFRLDIVGQKRYHRPQVHNDCDEKEEYLRKIFREPSVGVRRESEPEKGTLEQYFHKRGLIQPVSVNEGGTAEDI